MQDECMNEATKGCLHVASEVIVPSNAYRVSIAEHYVGLTWLHKAAPRYLVTNSMGNRMKAIQFITGLHSYELETIFRCV